MGNDPKLTPPLTAEEEEIVRKGREILKNFDRLPQAPAKLQEKIQSQVPTEEETKEPDSPGRSSGKK